MARPFGWDYPPGTPGPQAATVELRCVNPACDACLECVELPATTELGMTYLRDDEDGLCPECGWGMDDTIGRYAIGLAPAEAHPRYVHVVDTVTDPPDVMSRHRSRAEALTAIAALKSADDQRRRRAAEQETP